MRFLGLTAPLGRTRARSGKTKRQALAHPEKVIKTFGGTWTPFHAWEYAWDIRFSLWDLRAARARYIYLHPSSGWFCVRCKACILLTAWHSILCWLWRARTPRGQLSKFFRRILTINCLRSFHTAYLHRDYIHPLIESYYSRIARRSLNPLARNQGRMSTSVTCHENLLKLSKLCTIPRSVLPPAQCTRHSCFVGDAPWRNAVTHMEHRGCCR